MYFSVHITSMFQRIVFNSFTRSLKTLSTFMAILLSAAVFAQSHPAINFSEFLPEGHVLFEKVSGDLNNDGLNDCVLITKATDKSRIIKDEVRGDLDRNRRGIIVLFRKNDSYVPVVSNPDCFSSENEDGGVYFAPELSVSIKEGNLFIHYGHGRYGYWKYTFRAQNNDLELIGYDSSSNHGPYTISAVSMNFLTGKKLTRENLFQSEELEEEVFKETWEDIEVGELLKLSEVEDFDGLEVGY